MHVVRDEESGEAQSLDDAEHGQQRDRVADDEGGRGGDDKGHAERHEKTAADTIEPEADHGLAEDAGGAVDALDQPDLGLRPAQPVNVQRQEDETAEARHEEEVRERRPREGPAGDELEPADHERCGPVSLGRRMAATMTCVAMTRVKCSTRGE